MSEHPGAAVKAKHLAPLEQLALMAGAPDLFTFAECVAQAHEVLDAHHRRCVTSTGGSFLYSIGAR